MKKKVMIFGTFDNLHPGHVSFLKQARKLGDTLIVSLALESTIQKLKAKTPVHSFEKRKQALMQSGLVDEVVASDKKLGTYQSVQSIQPNIIALGYDQNDLKSSLSTWIKDQNQNIELVTLKPFKAKKYKSSLLNKYD